jgi:hypothetical protein
MLLDLMLNHSLSRNEYDTARTEGLMADLGRVERHLAQALSDVRVPRHVVPVPPRGSGGHPLDESCLDDFMANLGRDPEAATAYSEADLNTLRAALTTVRARLDYTAESRGEAMLAIDVELGHRERCGTLDSLDTRLARGDVKRGVCW